MFTRDVAKGIHRIEDAYTNWYLVEEGDRLTIVDCGVPTSWKSLMDALPLIDRSPSDIEAIVLTHAHFDHIGFAERARKEFQIPVWLHENDFPLTRHPTQYAHAVSRLPYLAKPAGAPIAVALFASRAFWPKPISEVERFSEQSETLPVPGSPRIIFTPGHTLGHCALHFGDRDVVITGDAIVMLDPYTGTVGPQTVSGAATADPERGLRSLDALVETGAGLVLTGHGEPWSAGVAEAVRIARAAGRS